MEISGKSFDIVEFYKYLGAQNFQKNPSKIVVHHTWSPSLEQWNGESTLYNIKKFYEREYGWPAGPHLFIADKIWEFTEMSRVGIHAGKLNATWQKGDKIRTGYDKPRKYQLKDYSIGIEVVGNYDKKKWEGLVRKNSLYAILGIMIRYDIDYSDIYFHRDVSSKTCPGLAITKEWLFEEIAKKRREIEDGVGVLGMIYRHVLLRKKIRSKTIQ